MARRIRSSRLSRYSEKQSRKQFIIFGLGTFLIIAILVLFSGSILNLFGNIIFGIKGEDPNTSQINQLSEVLQPPNLENIPSATSSAQIDISGTSIYEEGEIHLTVNEREVDSTNIRENQRFTFRRVALRNGVNRIKAHYSSDNGDSDFSREYIINLSSEKPELEITSPSEGTTFRRADRRINVSGTTDQNGSVTVNGFRAVVSASGSFSYLLELTDGDNKIIIEATNQAGVKESKEVNVKYED